MLTIFIQIVTIISLLTFTGLSIAAFVILSKMFIQIKYKNYLMENLVQNMSLFVKQSYKLNNQLATKNDTNSSNTKNDINECTNKTNCNGTQLENDNILLNNSSNSITE